MESIESKYLKQIFDDDQIKNLLDLLGKDIKPEDLLTELIKLAKSKKWLKLIIL